MSDENGVIGPKTKAQMPLIALVMLGAALLGAGWQGAVFVSSIETTLSSLQQKVVAIDAKLVGKTKAGWHAAQMRVWCKRAALQNPNFDCPNVNEVIDDTFQGGQ